MKHAYLLLEDGSIYSGTPFGAPAPRADELGGHDCLRAAGETFFNTSMLGYHEILSDPSCTGQLVVMTYPHIGNYGVDHLWTESHQSQSDQIYKAAGCIVRSYYDGPVTEGRITLDEAMRKEGVPGISEVDTRRLTLKLRDEGCMNGVILSPAGEELTDQEKQQALEWLRLFPAMEGRNLIPTAGIRETEVINPQGSGHMVIIDCGIKENIIRRMVQQNLTITLVAYTASADFIRSLSPDACFISNGPGDPAVLQDQIRTIASLIGDMPVFGICLGHQLISLALGAETYKMEFGHHGANHPVRDEQTGKTFVTTQNHGFSVRRDSLPEHVSLWFTNANDQTVEGITHASLPVSSVQFHPEAAPGPQDSFWIIDRFIEETKRHSH